MKIVATICAALALCAPAAASAQTWVRVVENEEATWFYDEDSLRSSGSTREVWVKRVMTQAGADGVAQYLVLMQFDCSARRVNVAALTGYDGSGTALISGDYLDNPEWEAIRPGTMDEGVLLALC